MSWTVFVLAITFFAQAPQRAPRELPIFPAATVALLESLDPDYRITLTTLNERAVRGLLETLQRSPGPAGTPVLVWLLANGDTAAYVDSVVYQLSLREHATRLPFGELADVLVSADVERKVLVAQLLRNVLGSPKQTITRADRDRLVAALIASLDVAHPDLRTWAAEALGQLRAREAVGPIAKLLEQSDGDYHQITRLHALAAIGAPQGAPTLERLARSAVSQEVREAAVSAYVRLTNPRDPAAQVRRLLWEQPDTDLEKRVLAEGKTALPAVWDALGGTARDRRAAAALLGWFRDLRSIEPIMKALDATPAQAIREQLLFDLNMILLTEAPSAAPADRHALAALHLRWVYEQLLTPRVGVRASIQKQRTVHMLPDRIAAPFSVDLGTAAAVLSPSREAFFASVGKTGFGVAFHSITESSGVARVATTLVLPGVGLAKQVWISLYRRDGARWVSVPVPAHPLLRRYISEPSLMPAINRNYGADHPLKVLRLDLTMERIRVDGHVREFLFDENVDYPLPSRDLDASYVPLLERYKRSDAAAVRYTAELYSARLTGQPNVELWVDALSRHAGTPIHAFAVRVLADYVTPRFRDHGRELAGAERTELIAATLKPNAGIDPRGTVPRPENVQSVRQWDRFGLVEIVSGSPPRGQSGYSALFERRGRAWVFLCVMSGWIS